MNEPHQVLTKNQIRRFLLKIDFGGEVPTEEIVNALKNDFARLERRVVSGYAVTIDAKSVEPATVKKEDTAEYCLANDHGAVLVVSPAQKAVIIRSEFYRDCTVYEGIVDKLSAICSNCMAKRIGLRYINVFPCTKVSQISHVLKTPYASAVRALLSGESICRAVCVQTVNRENGNLCNVQFGVPNDAFPNVIGKLDLLLDVDSAFAGAVQGAQWSEKIKVLNHSAYVVFRDFVTDQQVSDME